MPPSRDHLLPYIRTGPSPFCWVAARPLLAARCADKSPNRSREEPRTPVPAPSPSHLTKRTGFPGFVSQPQA